MGEPPYPLYGSHVNSPVNVIRISAAALLFDCSKCLCKGAKCMCICVADECNGRACQPKHINKHMGSNSLLALSMHHRTHVNFVSGTNGSGKSAVLQGLQCCLGATAKSTGRAASLEHFIRTGADDAKVQVTLWNTGDDAYMPHVLGETVTIERRISRRNNTAWKVYDARMRPVPDLSNRNGINNILDCFSVNASNPLAVMTQVGGSVVRHTRG